MELKFDEYQEGEFEKYLLDIARGNMKEYCDKHFKVGWSDDENRKSFKKTLKDGLVYTLRVGKEIIGYISLEVKENNCLHIGEIQIKEEYQGKGFGSKSLVFIEAVANRLKCNLLQLVVFNDNPARNLYERKGFRIVGDKFDGEAFLMQKELK